MRTKKIITLGLVGIMSFSLLSGCVWNTSKAREEERQYQEELMQQANDVVGQPEITNFYEKKQAKEIFELRDDSSLVCYAYTKCEGSGKYVYLGRCMGYGLPYSTQYTAPEGIVIRNGNSYVLPQADPNGLYLPEGMTATWLYLIDETTGEPQITYAEPEIMVSQGKLPARICESWSLPENY